MLLKRRITLVVGLYVLLFAVTFSDVYYYRLGHDWYIVTSIWLLFLMFFTFNKTINLINEYQIYNSYFKDYVDTVEVVELLQRKERGKLLE